MRIIKVYLNNKITSLYTNNKKVSIKEFNPTIPENIYEVELSKFNILNNNTNANATTEGINNAIDYAKNNGYTGIRFPSGTYSIDASVTKAQVTINGYWYNGGAYGTWRPGRWGIAIESDLTYYFNECTFILKPNAIREYMMCNIQSANNVIIKGGTFIGDRAYHDYGMRVTGFEYGSIDELTGELVDSIANIRTSNYIENYIDWFTKQEEQMPKNIWVGIIDNFYLNQQSGGKFRFLCYDENSNYLGVCAGNGTGDRVLLDGTKKFKIVCINEQLYTKRLNQALCIKKTGDYWNEEASTCFWIVNSNNVELNGVTVKDMVGDCVLTAGCPIKDAPVNDFRIINCDFSNSRRQGISYVSYGENYLLKNTKIHNINGIDPQCGIDIEQYDYFRDFVVDNCDFYDNYKLDFLSFNGEYVELKNSRFNGNIGSAYKGKMTIHDCVLEYDTPPQGVEPYNTSKDCSIVHTTPDITVYNNTMRKGRYSLSGDRSVSYNNNFYDSKVYIELNNEGITESDNFYNCWIQLNASDKLNTYTKGYFENSDLTKANNATYPLLVKDSTFKNSSFDMRNVSTALNCTFNLIDKTIISNTPKVEGTIINFEYCDIVAANSMLPPISSSKKMNFNNCNINISRDEIDTYPATISFSDCHIKFNNKVVSNVIWNKGDASYWVFNNCTFESELPIQIRGVITNPTIIGQVTVSTA